MPEPCATGQAEIAPDGSTVRVLTRTQRASVVHCSLAPGAISRAVRHQSVEEIWYCLHGNGRLWRGNADGARTEALVPGALFTLAPQTCFQFRNDGHNDLEILITTVPAWPGDHEARECEPYWTPSVAR
jgi:mannose-6-phosphate isomerase-like protein (cupin superfamily)